MADITVRKVRFSFEESFDFDVPDEILGATLPLLALSMTMPYLEPYLIRTMKVALERITDPVLAEEIEHRTVAFDVYRHLVGSYFYRVPVGGYAQWH